MLAFRLRQTSGEGGPKGRIRDQRVRLAGKRAEGNQNGTDGHRTIGRPWHASPLRNCSLVHEKSLNEERRPDAKQVEITVHSIEPSIVTRTRVVFSSCIINEC